MTRSCMSRSNNFGPGPAWRVLPLRQPASVLDGGRVSLCDMATPHPPHVCGRMRAPGSASPTTRLQSLIVFMAGVLMLGGPAWAAVSREPVTMKVVAVNPSADKHKTVPVRIDLPMEVKPSDILDAGELAVEFDTERSIYYLYKENVQLAPKQTKVFGVSVRDVWYIPNEELEGLKGHTSLMLSRLEKSEYYPFAQQLGGSITQRLDDILQMQADETIGRKQRIGAYRLNVETLKVVKEDLARMEKLLSFTGGPPVPEMMEESPLKSDAPSTTTTWLVIFLIITFMGLLAGQFFFTWQRRMKAMPEFSGRDAGELLNSDSPQDTAVEGRGAHPAERTPKPMG